MAAATIRQARFPMEVVVLGSVNSWYARDLARAARDRCALRCLPFSALEAEAAPGRFRAASAGEEISPEQVVLVRSMPPGSLEQVVFRMNLLHELAARGQLIVNPPRALELAIDKAACTLLLQRHGLPVPRTCICQRTQEAMAAWEQLTPPLVLKPLFGSEGRGITRLEDKDVAWRVFRTLEQHRVVFYLQEFVPHPGWDVRVLVVGDKLFCAKRLGGNGWRTNAAQGGELRPWSQAPPEALHLARQAAQAVGALLAGVDLIRDPGGRWLVLEVNAVPGWRHLARALQVDIAAEVLSLLQERSKRE